jgi:hypothetical protein
MIRFSFANLVAGASIAGSTTFADPIHPASQVQSPQRPFKRAWSTNLSAQRLTIDFGGSAALQVMALIHVNFTTATIQGNATDTWGSPSYSQAVTIDVSPNDRYQYAHRPSVAIPFNLRFLSFSIPNQATTDGAATFRIGGIWAGLIVSPPRDMLMMPEEEKEEYRVDLKTQDGRILQRLILDDPAWRITARRQAETETELAGWRAIDRQFSAAVGQTALVLQRDAYPAECYVMRMVSASKWPHAKVYSETDFELLESISA